MALSYKINFIWSELFEMLLYFCVTFTSRTTSFLPVETVIIAIILLAVAFVLLGVKVLFVKGGKFPSGHVHDNKALTSRGIHCAHSQKEDSRQSRQQS